MSHVFQVYKTDPKHLIHLMDSLTGGEYTICGDAEDLRQDENGQPDFRGMDQVDSSVVTCPRCAETIKHCQGVACAPAKEN